MTMRRESIFVNKRILTTFMLILAGALVLTACGGSAGSASPTTGAASAQITLSTNPNPPAMGPVELVVDVKDVQGQPLDGAEVLVLASHTRMSGMNQQGLATAQGSGRYAITADLSGGMSGEWLITVQVRKDDLNLAQDFRIEVR